MSMSALDFVAAGTVICLAGMAQSALGFGYALLATPLLVWIGLPLPSVIALVAVCSMFQSTLGAWKLRAAVPWRLALTSTAARFSGVVAGMFLLKRLVGLSADQVRMAVGLVLCLVVAVQFLWRPRPRERMHWGWAALAFLASGLLAGVSGMGGPPLVLWSMAHDWPARKSRGFLFAVFATSIPLQIALLSLTFGASILRDAALGVACLPLVYAGAAVGLPFGNRMSRDRLRTAAYAILFAIGLSAVVPPLLARLN